MSNLNDIQLDPNLYRLEQISEEDITEVKSISNKFGSHRTSIYISDFSQLALREVELGFSDEALYGLNPKASTQRKLEYVYGRACAIAAIKTLTGVRYSTIGRNADGSPQWPCGILGSISHCTGLAIAAVGHQTDCRFIGVDVMRLPSPESAKLIYNQIVFDEEFDLFESDGIGDSLTASIIFSAKESLYKALYPKCLKFFDFCDARVLSIDRDRGSFVISLKKNLSKDLNKGFKLQGKYIHDNLYTYTLIT